MKTRAKFKVDAVQKQDWGTTVQLSPVGCGLSKENEAFWNATPTGQITMTITTSAADQFEVGKEVYVDFTDANEAMLVEDVYLQPLTFGEAFEYVKQGKGMRLPQWASDVVIRAQYPDENSKMTAPYLYVESRFGRVPWKETMIELFAENWTIVD